MRIKQVKLKNFRNYRSAEVPLSADKTILIGENAQGKSNFLEAIEILSYGKSARAGNDSELIAWGQQEMQVEILFEKMGAQESIVYRLQPGNKGLQKQLILNGLSQNSMRKLLGHLITVSFKSYDLNLLRGGPKHRRDWLDGVILRIKPGYLDIASRYARVLLQRNRLLKSLFEKGRVSVEDQDQLLSWDKQVAQFGAQIIKLRMRTLSELLPLASKHHQHISGSRESLDASYLFRAREEQIEQEDSALESPAADAIPVNDLSNASQEEIETVLLGLLRSRRAEEIGRRQTIIGPHRDDIVFSINAANAVAFASQGQQRSLVLSIKLAELTRISESMNESPILLLDDVLAELDMSRQGFLMSAIPSNMQTVITTTHVSGFEPKWLDGAAIVNVTAGNITQLPSLSLAP